jgi:uncharacterized protein (TIGR03118 family)
MSRKILILSAFMPLAACGPSMGTSGASAALAAHGPAPYVQRNLVSDGFLPAEHTDANLVNAWGIAHRPTSPWWVSDNGAGVSTLYDGEGVARPLVVSVTGANGRGAPTGVVANSGTGFVVSTSPDVKGAAFFIFASEDGTISGWNPGVPAPPTSTQTIVAVDHSSPDPLGGAVYKGLAIAGDRLYASDFRGGKVDVFDSGFQPVITPGAFVDHRILKGFAPFGIQALGDTIFVTYAKQDEAKHDDAAGKHRGFVNAFTKDGAFVRRVASRGKLDSPWGLAMAPPGFGPFSNHLLVGNFGDGHIVAFGMDGEAEAEDRGKDEDEGEDEGRYLTDRNGPIVIEGLWGLGFGNGAAAGPVNALFFAAGPGGEAHGLFGRIDPPPGQ